MRMKLIASILATLVSVGLVAQPTKAQAQHIGPEALFGAAAAVIGAAAIANAHRNAQEERSYRRYRHVRPRVHHRPPVRHRPAVAQRTERFGGQARDPFAASAGSPRQAATRDPFAAQAAR